MSKSAFAIVAHPDDIEFRMAGTLLLLREAGWTTHYMTLSSGNCGSTTMSANQTRKVRRRESQNAAKLLGAKWYPPISDDLEIIYSIKFLRKLAAVIRKANPTIVLTHPPVDYMEDHTATCRLAVTATFSRGMPNFVTSPRLPICTGDVAVYHCTPHGLVDPLRRPMVPEFFVDTTAVHDQKAAALAAHKSQMSWLQASQDCDAMTAYLNKESLQLGKQSGSFRHAEGWWRHSHLGFSAEGFDPLGDALKSKCKKNPKYNLNRGLHE